MFHVKHIGQYDESRDKNTVYILHMVYTSKSINKLSTNYQQTINIESVRNSYSLVIHLKNSSISQGIRVMVGILESINPYKGVETSRKLVINGAILQC